MKKLVNWLRNEESGQGMVEYGLIIALVAVVVIVGLMALGPKIRDLFTGVSNAVPTVSGSGT